ncbi:serine hydrolase domain-containing protein [Pontimicrobium aquaticum]|uniref:Beta-lactamase family protein n=1 Tax=Pontimicrobium aquaticum TaxID=2565367 RepID=A0A4U0EVP2_9FLAO|nr:serine hydrolase domain-containing protein [Pontimicrobium aquaticum]TJY35945.1 beta-lactamase family protein [Pontimicrobium aquaticum]
MKKTINQTLKTKYLCISFALFSIIVNAQIAKQIDSLALVHASKGFNGNVLYSKNNSIVFTGNYGFSDFSSKKPLNDSTVFELASLSKQFTALAIVQLVEKGLIDYKTKVSKVIPKFPYKNITIEHLLRHQSGLPDYQKLFYDKKIWNRKKMATNQDVLNVLAKLKPDLMFAPGSKYDYDNTGYVVLALIIETASKQSYKTYVTNNIFKPAGMKTARVFNIEKHTASLNNTAKGYTYNKKRKNYQKVENDKNHKHIKWLNGVIGDRGIYASILDLEKWKKALRNNILITKQGKTQMFSVDTISPKYGYGFAIYETQSKGKWVYHNGSWSGYKTSAIYLPDSNEYLLILSNNRYEETYKTFEEDFYNLIQ